MTTSAEIIQAAADFILDTITANEKINDPAGTVTDRHLVVTDNLAKQIADAIAALTGPVSIQLVPQSSEPAGAAEGMQAASDGTASTNGFGIIGGGLYQYLSGRWEKV